MSCTLRVVGSSKSARDRRSSLLRWWLARDGKRFGEWGWRNGAYEFEVWDDPDAMRTWLETLGFALSGGVSVQVETSPLDPITGVQANQ